MPPSPRRTVKVGVVGCGVVATAYYLPYLMKHADLIAVCDMVGAIESSRTGRRYVMSSKPTPGGAASS